MGLRVVVVLVWVVLVPYVPQEVDEAIRFVPGGRGDPRWHYAQAGMSELYSSQGKVPFLPLLSGRRIRRPRHTGIHDPTWI
jgi:hypothetical protein